MDLTAYPGSAFHSTGSNPTADEHLQQLGLESVVHGERFNVHLSGAPAVVDPMREQTKVIDKSSGDSMTPGLAPGVVDGLDKPSDDRVLVSLLVRQMGQISPAMIQRLLVSLPVW